MNYTHFEDGMYDNYQYLLNGGKQLWSKSFAFDFTKTLGKRVMHARVSWKRDVTN